MDTAVEQVASKGHTGRRPRTPARVGLVRTSQVNEGLAIRSDATRQQPVSISYLAQSAASTRVIQRKAQFPAGVPSAPKKFLMKAPERLVSDVQPKGDRLM
jgi:hypothetical protein